LYIGNSIYGGTSMNAVEQLQEKLKNLLKAAVEKAQLLEEGTDFQVQIEVPKDQTKGDFATNLAMQLTKLAKKPPRQIAEAIVGNLETEGTEIEKVEIAGPGFINIFVRKDFLADIVKAVF